MGKQGRFENGKTALRLAAGALQGVLMCVCVCVCVCVPNAWGHETPQNITKLASYQYF